MTMHFHRSILDCKRKTIFNFSRFFSTMFTLWMDFVLMLSQGNQSWCLISLLSSYWRQFLFLKYLNIYIIFVLLFNLVVLLVESVDDFVHVITNVIGKGWIMWKIPSWGVPSSNEAYFFRRVMCYLASWILLKRSFPFI